VLPGLEDMARQEVGEHVRGARLEAAAVAAGRLRLSSSGPLAELNGLRSVVAAHRVLRFQAAGPRALLGHQALSSIVQATAESMAAYPSGTFRTLRLSAAGGGSAVMQRLRAELASALGIEAVDAPAHLQFVVRRGAVDGVWEVLVRTSPRPLGARAWRVCDWPGALNGTAAFAMARLSEPRLTDRFVNICCGSGTLLIERLLTAPAAEAWGFDVDADALACARANLAAGQLSPRVQLRQADARALPFADGSVSVVTADLPFAMRSGSGAENRALYPALLREAARVLEPGGRMVLLSTQQRLLAGVLRAQAELWQPWLDPLVIQLPYQRGVIRPGIQVLRRA
jgi:tRNA (guanine6-N2)-methyltransferase